LLPRETPSVSAYTIDLTTGTINANGDSVPTGGVPVAVVLSPSGTALFVANSGTNDISAYTVKTDDGTHTPASGTTPTGGMTPLSMAMDSGGPLPLCGEPGTADRSGFGTISVFAVRMRL
jgi:6-phosphogluconolactonase (cycloisomerase 2 family)